MFCRTLNREVGACVLGANKKAPTPTLGSLQSSLQNILQNSSHVPPNSHIPIIPTPPLHVIGARPRAWALGWGGWGTWDGGGGDNGKVGIRGHM